MESAIRQRGRRGGRGEPVRDALVRAGQTLFARQPVDAVAIDDIVREADVAKGSFYKHFPDKEALLGSVVRRIFARIEQEVAEANAGEADAAARVVRALCVYFRYVAAHPEQGGVLVRNNRIGWALPVVELNPGTVADIRHGLLAGRFVTPTVEAGSLMVQGVGHAGLIRFTAEPQAQTIRTGAQHLCQLLLGALGLDAAEAAAIAARAAEDVLGGRP